MSSHHFVKEDQEPALLIVDPDAIPFERVQELLEWSPLVIVSPSALEKVQQWGIKIDVLVISNAENTVARLVADQTPIHILNSNGTETELDSVGNFLIGRKQINLNVIANEAQRYFTIASSFLNRVNIVLFDSTGRWHFVGNGKYSKWLPAQSILHTFINGSVKKCDVQETGIFEIKQNEPFWVGEEY